MGKKRNNLARERARLKYRGQASVEFLVIIGLLLIILLAGIVFISQESDATTSKFKQTATRIALQNMASAAKEVYFQGNGARTTIPLYFPEGVANISFAGQSIIAEFENGNRMHEYLGFAVQGNITPGEGNMLVKLDSFGSFVYAQPSYEYYAFVVAPPETQPPSITFEQPTPANASIITLSYIYVNATIIDNISVSIVYLEWNGVNETMSSFGSNYFKNKTSLSAGNYTFRIYASDASGNWNVSAARTIAVNIPQETQPPSITFEQPTPANASIVTDTYVFINATIIDNISVATVYLEWNGVNETMSSFGSNYFKNKTNLADANYTYRIYANDTTNNWNVSETRTVNVNAAIPLETQPPNITFEQPTPANGAVFSVNFAYINATIIDNISVALVYLEWNGVNESMSSFGSNYFKNKTSLANGNYTYRIYASDTTGNWNVSQTRSVIIAKPATTIRWATLTGPGALHTAGAPDNVYDYIDISNTLYAYNFDVSGLSGNITNVTLVWSHEVPGALSNDFVNLWYGLVILNEKMAKTYTSANTPVDRMGTTPAEWEYYDATGSRPSGGSWQWSDFSTLRIGGQYKKTGTTDSQWRLDAVGVNITYVP